MLSPHIAKKVQSLDKELYFYFTRKKKLDKKQYKIFNKIICQVLVNEMVPRIQEEVVKFQQQEVSNLMKK